LLATVKTEKGSMIDISRLNKFVIMNRVMKPNEWLR